MYSTALSWAARSGHGAIVRLLVGRDDIDICTKENGGQTPLSWLVKYRSSKNKRDGKILFVKPMRRRKKN